IMARASGRLRFKAETTSIPLPSPSRKSTTAKAGAALAIWLRPSATLSQDVTAKPLVSMARARRSRNGLSSSTIRSERSVCPASSGIAFKIKVSLSNKSPTYGGDRGDAKTAGYRFGVKVTASYWFCGRFLHLEPATRPNDLHHGAVLRENAVGKRDPRARALEQGAGDEHAKTKATAAALRVIGGAAARQIGLADALEQIG